MRIITREQHAVLLSRYCDKQKHRFRTNHLGATWCVICGKLADGSTVADDLQENDKLKIVNNIEDYATPGPEENR